MVAQNNWPLIINLGNSIIGVSVLAMPFCFKQCGILLGILVLLFCTWLTLCSCSLLMKAGIKSRRQSYEFLAYHTHGATGKFVSEVGMIGLQMGTLIAQIVIIGDLGPAIVAKILGIENTSNLRTAMLILLCLGVGLPLGLLKDLQSVSRGSTFCVGFYCVFVIYILVSALPNLWSGDWYFKVNLWRPQGLFQCLPILSFSFGCQTQLFIVYEELPEPSLKSISNIISSAVNLCAVAYLLVGFFGYISFHLVDVPGDILAVFPSTLMADSMKIFFVLSIVLTFPVIIFPCRASIYTLLFAPKAKAYDDTIEGGSYIPENLFKAITICIIMVSMITGILIPNVEFILGMNGAIMGTLICYIFPALFFLKVIGTGKEGKAIAQVVLFLGVTILLVSTFATLSSQDKGHTHPEHPDSRLLAVDPNKHEIRNLDHQIPAKPSVKPVVDAKINSITFQAIHQQADGLEKRKEPAVPNAPISDEKKEVVNNVLEVPEKTGATLKKKNGSDVKVKSSKINPPGGNGTAHLEKEKKQEEILRQLEKHRQDQEKLLQEQKQVLKELKDHKQEDEAKKGEKKEEVVLEKVKEDVQQSDLKDEIVKQQQELLKEQQKINQQQQELIQQQQVQLQNQMAHKHSHIKRDLPQGNPDTIKNIPDADKNIPDVDKNIPGAVKNIPDAVKNIPDAVKNIPDLLNNNPNPVKGNIDVGNPGNSDERLSQPNPNLAQHNANDGLKNANPHVQNVGQAQKVVAIDGQLDQGHQNLNPVKNLNPATL